MTQMEFAEIKKTIQETEIHWTGKAALHKNRSITFKPEQEKLLTMKHRQNKDGTKTTMRSHLASIRVAVILKAR